jgi:hypothetical protein
MSAFENRFRKCAASIPGDPFKLSKTFLFMDFQDHINSGLTYDTVLPTLQALFQTALESTKLTNMVVDICRTIHHVQSDGFDQAIRVTVLERLRESTGASSIPFIDILQILYKRGLLRPELTDDILEFLPRLVVSFDTYYQASEFLVCSQGLRLDQ